MGPSSRESTISGSKEEAAKDSSKEKDVAEGKDAKNTGKANTDGKAADNKNEKTDAKETKADYRRPQALKRSDNPDVIYGKDFEDDAMPISEVIGEIGGSHYSGSDYCH